MKELSLRARLFLSLSAILGLGLLLFLFLGRTETARLERIALERLQTDADSTVRRLYEKIGSFNKESRFLAQLEIMDDIVAGDLDARIARLLRLKADDIGYGVRFFVYDADGKFVTVSRPGGELPPREVALCRDREAVTFGSFFYAAPIHASFDPDRTLGCLVLSLPLRALKSFLHPPARGLAWFEPPDANYEGFEVPSRKRLEEYIYTLRPLEHPFEAWKVGFALQKEAAFAPVRQMRQALLATFALMTFLALILVIWVDHRLLGPIRRLAQTVSAIAEKGTYANRLPPVGGDLETARLERAFNTLLSAVSAALESLKRQGEAHERSLLQLMRFIEKIAECQTAEETIEIAKKELSTLTGAKSIRWCEKAKETKNGEKTVRLRLQTSSHDYGSICLEGAENGPGKRQRFFDTLAHIMALQIERLEALRTTREALQSKTSFFSALSHELRTPLGSILSLCQYVTSSGRCGTREMEAVGRIESSAEHLLQIINDILLLAKAEAGRLEPLPQPCDLVPLIDTTVETLRPLAEVKELEISFQTPLRTLETQTDPKLFRQLLINLIANAVHYTDNGSVTVRLRKEGSKIEITVEDTGRGISEKELPKVFEEFYRVDESRPGTGLGLAISKRIAEALGGTLSLESRPGKGTRARVTLSV